MKVYITKCALTRGILEVECTLSDDVKTAKGLYTRYHLGEWWTSLEIAKEVAEQMRKRKLASLRNQINKLEALKF